MNVSSVASSSGMTAAINPQLKNIHQLSKAVRTGDLDDAKQAYMNIIKDAPPGATWNPDSAFAQLGKALKQGDLASAKTIIVQAVQDARAAHAPAPTPTPVPADGGPISLDPGSVNLTA
jgi:hypothetical protein